MNSIAPRLSSLRFDCAGAALATLSYVKNWSGVGGIAGTLAGGLEAFAVAALGDRIARYLLSGEEKKGDPQWVKGISSALVEEGIYSGVLLTQNKWCILPRFAASFATGATAARTLVGPPGDPSEGISLDNKIGIAWAAARESLLCFLPLNYSLPLLIGADTAVFALSEVCPSKDIPAQPPKLSPAWSYKALSAAFFRSVANTAAATQGIGVSILQHLLYNVSRTLPG